MENFNDDAIDLDTMIIFGRIHYTHLFLSNQVLVVSKMINADPRLKVDRGFHLACNNGFKG